jgi:hypothetical protein
MSKETKQFDVAIIDYSDASVRLERRSLPSDIQTDELEEILVAEDKYKPSECYLLFKERPADGGDGIVVEDYR